MSANNNDYFDPVAPAAGVKDQEPALSSSSASTVHKNAENAVKTGVSDAPSPKGHDGHVTYLSTGDTKPEREPREKPLKVLKEEDCYDELAFAWPTWKKWWVLIVVFLVQCSMNLNTSLYSNAVSSRPDHKGLTEEFGISAQAARCGAMIFLVTYAFGCELWAPWSEEFGRKPVLQLSLFFVNVWQLPVALAPNFGSVLVGRALGGLFSAGGSVTLGLIADLYEPEDHQYAVNFVVLSSVGGSVLGAIVGGICEQWLKWQWCIWLQLIFGGFVQLLHLFTVPETRTTTMMTAIAKRRRAQGEEVWGPDEIVPWTQRLTFKEIISTWTRPFVMFLTEPIVLVLSLLSGFSDGLIFIFIQSFALVYEQWGFKTYQNGLAFIPLGLGYIIAFISFLFSIKRNRRRRAEFPEDERVQFEERMWWLLFTAPLLPIGLISFAWTSGGPPIHWIGSMICAALVGIANFAIYMATIDYMITAYGPYSASATGGNGWSRDFLAGVLTIPAVPFYSNIGKPKNLQNASTILFCISFVLVSAVYVVYWKGPTLRKRSPFAQQLSDERKNEREHAAASGHPIGPVGSRRSATTPNVETDPEKAGAAGTEVTSPGAATTPGPQPMRPTLSKRHSTARELQELRVRPGLTSRRSSYMVHGPAPNERNSRGNSRANSRNPSRNVSRNPSRSNSFDEDRDDETGQPNALPHSFAERLQMRLARPGLGSRNNTHLSTASALGNVQEASGREEA